MPISALVLTLDSEHGAALLAELAGDSRFLVGELQQGHLPLVMEAASLAESRDLFEALQAHPRVTAINVVSIDFSDDGANDPELGHREHSHATP